jgi:hypothetical protein
MAERTILESSHSRVARLRLTWARAPIRCSTHQRGLRLQQLSTLLKVGFGPILAQICLTAQHAVFDLTTAISPNRLMLRFASMPSSAVSLP